MDQKIGITLSSVLAFILLLPLTLHKNEEKSVDTEPPSFSILKSETKVSEKPVLLMSSITITEPVQPIVIPEIVKTEEPKVVVIPQKPVLKPIAIPQNNYDQEYIKQRICEVWGPTQCANAIKIAQLESGLRTNAKSATNDFGVMQVNCTAHAKKVGGDCTKLFDLETNLRVAKGIYDGSRGWSPWTTSKKLATL